LDTADLVVQAVLVICGLFMCDFAYMRLRIGHFSVLYPIVYSHPWVFNANSLYGIFGPYLSHITRDT